MSRTVPVTMLGVLLLATLAVGLVGVAIAIASIAAGDKTDFTATWRLESDHDVTVKVTEDEDVYRATLKNDGSGLERTATLVQVDRFQLAGPLDAPPKPGEAAGGGLPVPATVPAGTTLSIVAVNDDTVAVAVRPRGEDRWTDLGTYVRAGLWSDPFRFAGVVILGIFAVMAIVMVFEVPVAGGTRAKGAPGPGKIVLRGAAVVLVAVLLVALLAAQPAVARLAFVILFAVWLGYMVKWLPAEVTGTGEFLDYVFSKARREQITADAVARDEQAERGVDLERTLRGVRQEWSVAPSRPQTAATADDDAVGADDEA